jgi:hypothetical protein
MQVNINEIQKITFFLLSKIKESNGNEVEINNDFYWDIDDNELYNPYEEPKDITLGQLSHDMEELQRLNESDDAIIYDLKRLSEILRAISIEYPTLF